MRDILSATLSESQAVNFVISMNNPKPSQISETVETSAPELLERLIHQAPPDTPTSGRLSRQVKHFPIEPEVSIRSDEKGAYYVLNLVAADRPGLLYTVATTLAEFGASLHTAKIATLGERVEDVFLLSGGDLVSSGSRIQLETELMERLRV